MAQMLGKKAVKHDPRTMKLSRYTAALAPAPPACDITTGKVTDLGMMLNDSLGDCTCAAAGHMVQCWSAESGAQLVLPDSMILSAYEAVGGYVPGDPSTDNGAVELDVLNYWRQTGIGGHKISAYAAVSQAKLQAQVQQAVYYFGGCYIGVELPITAQDQPTWDLVSTYGDGESGSWGGHAVPIVAYNPKYATVITWGAYLNASWAFLRQYMSEGYALLSADIFDAAGKSPEGFDLAQLTTDLSEVTS